MKKLIFLIVLALSSIANAQSFTVFDIDTTNFPTIKAKFYAFDADGKQISNLSPSDFEITENGTPRTVTNVSCPAPKPLEALSSVLVFDISGSIGDLGLDIEKLFADAWINSLPLGKSDCAITSFNYNSYINQDFSTNKNRLTKTINSISCTGSTDFDIGLLDAQCGGINIAKTGKNKRIILFLSDGYPNVAPNTNEIINQALANNITIYCITIGSPTPQCMMDFANQTGGLYFGNVNTKENAINCCSQIIEIALGGEPCKIEWSSEVVCRTTDIKVNMKYFPLNITITKDYKSPLKSIATLEFNPTSVAFNNPAIGVKVEEKLTLTAINANFKITNITSTNPSFYITPTSFILNNGQSKQLTINYIPADSGYNFCKFTFENDACAANYYVSGGYKGIRPKLRTLKLLHPNGAEVFVAGIDTIISWEGILPEENIKIEYSTNNGSNWTTITDSATGLCYKWRIPKTPSNQCLARITADATTSSYCEVQICGQIWMGCNLDVETYRNGDTIPQVSDPGEWEKQKTGAWCYYNNDPAMGKIYGKLYNWDAISDPRGLAPDGWHIPSSDEWIELSICLGTSYVAGGKLKSTGTIEDDNGLWKAPNEGATNESGFSALPGGWRYYFGLFDQIGDSGYWWSSTISYSPPLMWCWNLTYFSVVFDRTFCSKKHGLSVRCVKD